MRETSDVRRRRILAVVRARGTARVHDLASELEVSVVTVRRDVEELAREGKLRRGHGVARSIVPVEESAPAEVAERSGTVALVVPERHAYLYEAVHGARAVLEEAGMRVVLHIAPEAAIGGPLAAVRSGDRIRLSVADKRIDLLVSEHELKQRLAGHILPPAPARGYAALYHNSVTQAPSGCDFDFLMDAE